MKYFEISAKDIQSFDESNEDIEEEMRVYKKKIDKFIDENLNTLGVCGYEGSPSFSYRNGFPLTFGIFINSEIEPDVFLDRLNANI